ncbi:hypothetical protein [Streptomyces sp. NPDC005374]|uniref:hypothetical protein n=1 Tax=Streptomyces sp. NPDC005374 TaxID=3364713 RepID=UPI0036CAA4CD
MYDRDELSAVPRTFDTGALAYQAAYGIVGDKPLGVEPVSPGDNRYLKVRNQEARQASLTALRDQLRDAYGPFMCSLAVVSLECRPGPIDAARAVHAASTVAYTRLIAVEEEISGADAFCAAVNAYLASVDSFIEAARQAEQEP